MSTDLSNEGYGPLDDDAVSFSPLRGCHHSNECFGIRTCPGFSLCRIRLGPITLLAEPSNDERIYIEAGLNQIGLKGQVGIVDDLQEDDTHDDAVTICELVIRVLALLALEVSDAQPLLLLLVGLGLG